MADLPVPRAPTLQQSPLHCWAWEWLRHPSIPAFSPASQARPPGRCLLATLGLENESKGINCHRLSQNENVFLGKEETALTKSKNSFSEMNTQSLKNQEGESLSLGKTRMIVTRPGTLRVKWGWRGSTEEKRRWEKRQKWLISQFPGVGRLQLGLFLRTLWRNLANNDSECGPREVSHLPFPVLPGHFGKPATKYWWSSPAPFTLRQLTTLCCEANLSKQSWTSLRQSCQWKTAIKLFRDLKGCEVCGWQRMAWSHVSVARQLWELPLQVLWYNNLMTGISSSAHLIEWQRPQSQLWDFGQGWLFLYFLIYKKW